jgi:trehalose 6-phosphate synthase
VSSRPGLIVVSNRGPARGDDRRGPHHGSGGLVTALLELGAHADVTWIASAPAGEEAVPFDIVAPSGASIRVRPVAHDPEAFRLFYTVVANPVLWFVQHGLAGRLHEPPAAVTGPWERGYVRVNEGFAAAVLEELDRRPCTPVVFHDYHLYVAPRLVRDAHPRARLGHFVHVPWVGPAAWSVLPAPVVAAVHDGLLACDTVGFHTARWRDAFVDASAALLGRGAEAAARARVNPISVDPHVLRQRADGAQVAARARRVAADRPEVLVLRVDRLDPAKNAVRGFEAYGELLRRRPDLHGRIELRALLDPSRVDVPEYAAYRDELMSAAAAVVERFGRGGWEPVRVGIRDDRDDSLAAYRHYDVLLVNSVMDGMNLVAKEGPLVNERDGALVLSRAAGAYAELGEWVEGCDPLDVCDQADALERALSLARDERAARQQAIRTQIRAHDLAAWARAEIAALEPASTMPA